MEKKQGIILFIFLIITIGIIATLVVFFNLKKSKEINSNLNNELAEDSSWQKGDKGMTKQQEEIVKKLKELGADISSDGKIGVGSKTSISTDSSGNGSSVDSKKETGNENNVEEKMPIEEEKEIKEKLKELGFDQQAPVTPPKAEDLTAKLEELK